MDRKLRACILANDQADDHMLWVNACNDYSNRLDFDVVNLTSANWFKEINRKVYDCFLAKPPGIRASIKQLYDERIHIITQCTDTPIIPKPQEIYIYENKRYFYSWLSAMGLPHPETKVYYFKDEVLAHIDYCTFPIVAKNNIGASGSGIKILRSKEEATGYVNDCFSSKGATRRWGPNFSKGGIIKRGFHYILNPRDIRKKVNVYKDVRSEKQKGFVILQQFVPHEYEWRVVVIGDSYFAHKKMKIGDKASGSLLKNYDNPPLRLFDFAKSIIERFGFTSQAIDIFETSNGKLLINEMQCIFGQSDPYQMLVEGKPGRYRFIENNWIFEPGDFNQNQSYNLRLEYILQSNF